MNIPVHSTVYEVLQRSFETAISKGYVETIEGLLKIEGFKPRDLFESLKSPHTSSAIIEAVLEDPRWLPYNQWLALKIFLNNRYLLEAVEAGSLIKVLGILKRPELDPSFGWNRVLMTAIRLGHLEEVKLLMDDPRIGLPRTSKPLAEACLHNQPHVVEYLPTVPGILPEAKNNLALYQAVDRGHVEVVKLLLADPRVDPSQDDNRILKHALTQGHAEIIKILSEDPRVSGPVSEDD